MDNIGDSAAIRLVKRKGGELCCVTTFLFPYARVVSYPTSVTHLPSTTLRRSVGIEAVPLISRACQSTSSHSPRFAPVNYLTLPYLSQGWAKIHRSHSHSTPHPGAQRQSSSIKLPPCTFSQPKQQSFDQSTSCVACRLPVKPLQHIE